MMDLDPRDTNDTCDLEHQDIYDRHRADDQRDRGDDTRERDPGERDPRDPFIEGLDLPRGLERELVQDDREHLYELNGEDSRMLATVGAFRVVAECDLHDVHSASQGPRDDTLEHLNDEGLVRLVQIDTNERAAVLTDRGLDVLDSHRRDRDSEAGQEFHSGRGRNRELKHDAKLFGAYLEVEGRLRADGASIERIVLERDLRREYQEFLQERNRDRPDSDGRPDRDPHEIEEWAREHDLPYFDGHVHIPDFRVEYELNGRELHEDVEVVTEHYRGAHAASRSRSGFTCFGGSGRGRGGTPFSPNDWRD